jgi:hypothetical protein
MSYKGGEILLLLFLLLFLSGLHKNEIVKMKRWPITVVFVKKYGSQPIELPFRDTS